MTKKTSEKLKLCHLEYAKDLCLKAPTIAIASKIIEHLTETLRKYHMRIASEMTVWLSAGNEYSPSTLEATGISFITAAKMIARDDSFTFVSHQRRQYPHTSFIHWVRINLQLFKINHRSTCPDQSYRNLLFYTHFNLLSFLSSELKSTSLQKTLAHFVSTE